MSLSKEAKIGILVTVSLVIFFIGFYFLKGASLFSNDKDYYCYYSNVDGLQNSANVQIRGLNIGHVSGMHLVDGKGVRVTVSIGKNVEIPEGTIASLVSFDLLGTKMVRLDLGNGPAMLPPGASLPTNSEGGIVDNVSAELTPRLQEMKATIVSFDSALSGINAVVSYQNQKAIAAAIKSIQTTADNLAELSSALKNEGGEMTGILHNANSITANLARNNDTINRILTNINKLSGQLAKAPVQKTVMELQKTIADFQGIADKINNNEGSLGMLINNKDLYNNLNNSLRTLNSLMSDIQAHPSHYVNVTVFGKKKK